VESVGREEGCKERRAGMRRVNRGLISEEERRERRTGSAGDESQKVLPPHSRSAEERGPRQQRESSEHGCLTQAFLIISTLAFDQVTINV
jgi:hypothetical protein